MWLKKLMVFQPPFGLNNDYGGGFERGYPPVNWGLKRAQPPRRPPNLRFCNPAHALWWVPEAFLWKPRATCTLLFKFMFEHVVSCTSDIYIKMKRDKPSLGPGIVRVIIHVVWVWFNLWVQLRPRLIFTASLHFYMSLVHDATCSDMNVNMNVHVALGFRIYVLTECAHILLHNSCRQDDLIEGSYTSSITVYDPDWVWLSFSFPSCYSP